MNKRKSQKSGLSKQPLHPVNSTPPTSVRPDDVRQNRSIPNSESAEGWEDFDTRRSIVLWVSLRNENAKVSAALLMLQFPALSRDQAKTIILHLDLIGAIEWDRNLYIVTGRSRIRAREYLDNMKHNQSKRTLTDREIEFEKNHAEIERLAKLPDDDGESPSSDPLPSLDLAAINRASGERLAKLSRKKKKVP